MIWILLITFQAKHFLADYILQNKYMLGKFKAYPDFIAPLATHSMVHAVMTFFIAGMLVNQNTALVLAVFDFVTHFTIDRIKASPEMLGKYKPLNKTEYIAAERAASGHTASGKRLVGMMAKAQVVKHAAAAQDRLDGNKYFWWALGWDQTMHHLTHYVIIYFIMR